MISQRIRAFILVFLASVNFYSKAYPDESEPKNSLKEPSEVESPSLISDPSNKLSEKIEETLLGKINFNGIGLIAIERTEFPDDLWSNSSEKALSEKLNAMSRLSLASTNKIFKRLLLVDAKPPLNSIGTENMGYSFLLSRIDQLINMGALDEADEILNYIKEPSIEFMKRKIEVASLNGRLSKTCDIANKYPNFKGMLQFKIICLVRENDWQAAALAFTVGSSLNQFSQNEEQLLLNYLDPDIEMNYNDRIVISELSPTDFFLMHGKKDIIPQDVIPNKYAYAFSRSDISPLVRIKSVEQLASSYVVNANTLFDLYRSSPDEKKDEARNAKRTVFELDRSLENDNEQKTLSALIKAVKVFQKKNLLTQMSTEYEDELKKLYQSNDKKLFDLAIALLSLTDNVSSDFYMSRSTIPSINCLLDINKKIFTNHETDNDLCRLVKNLNIQVIKKSFPRNRDYESQMEKGLILLESLNILRDGVATKTGELKLALTLLTKIGLIDLVNQISKELIALNAVKKLAM